MIRRKNWGKRGRRKNFTGQRRRGRVKGKGGIREGDRKRVCFFIKKGEGDIFYEQLLQLNKLIKEEWISQGNCAEDFQERGPKIILILDNASFHRRKDILAKIAQELTNFILLFFTRI